MGKIDDLIAQGAVQCSRKYRRLFVAPRPASAYIREKFPERYDSLVEKALAQFEADARAVLWSSQPNDCVVTLTSTEFAEFYEKTNGRKIWSAEDKTPCPDCQSLGHMHRRDCPSSE
jgi:hypothetical protein